MGFISAFVLVGGVAIVLDNPALGLALIASGLAGIFHSLRFARGGVL